MKKKAQQNGKINKLITLSESKGRVRNGSASLFFLFQN
jgi:hypothetical protein